MKPAFGLFLLLLATQAQAQAQAADWPMWRHDPGRTATTSQKLTAAPENLKLKWVHHLFPPKPAWNDTRLQFDKGFEPIQLGKRLIVGSSWDDSVTAFDTDSGEQIWKFFADGPVRFAPVGGQGRILFGSDDGYFYCVKASDGSLVWKRKAVPNDRKVIGNGRLISVWPVRGGPVLKDERVYFAAGVWPLEGVFVFCLDVKTGEEIWRNDACSYKYGIAPHNAEAFGGLAPQGYLLIDGEDLVVPSSNAYPARLDLATGKLKEFDLPAPGRLTGGWFASTPSAKEEQKLKRRGLLFDKEVNVKRHEDKPRAEGQEGVRSTIRTADHELKFADPGLPGIEGKVHSIIAGDGKVFATTEEGAIYCFAAEGEGKELTSRWAMDKVMESGAAEIVRGSGKKHGFGVILGLKDVSVDFCKSLLTQTEMNFVIVGSDAAKINEMRTGLSQSVAAERINFQVADPANFEMPKYFADLVVISDPGINPDSVFESARPFGGTVFANGKVTVRNGAIPGTTNYTGGWVESADELVRSPVGLQWYGDATQHFKRSPQPKFVDGVMISQNKDWLDASTRKNGLDYRLLEPMFTDVYTGRTFSAEEVPVLRQSFADPDLKTVQPSQYRPPKQKNDWKPDAPKAGTRKNPLTGEKEPRVFPKSYGCDGGFDYGKIYSMRSGTAAFYDKMNESGTINIAGPRSGCTNSVIPANGLLNLPYFYEGCTCSYPLPSALALISMPEKFEQWTSWGDMPAEKLAGKIQRLGINFGAPGDRKTRDGTLWLDIPNVGGPSPQIEVATVPEKPEFFYQHSLFLPQRMSSEPREKTWPWVVASGARGLNSITIGGLKTGDYKVRLVFPDEQVEDRELTAGSAGKIQIDFAEPTDVSGIELVQVGLVK
ncbi:MAG: PQQ-like beta-propeller repeat protein [Verrucomicrobiales bacterium]|nr:PQQ-like beta-propeller repeat protein [Verrucomicrobiales bacterium]